ncbi:DUF4249 family protein [Dawidia soli]|uniref:DUF4249 family protein n=1 Tax=Dawidia soli TaxID=2782352 RepID=A0AAP2D8K2_9BACT|nr:DUF4249 family protein [Dawidia soli]MBT1686070.1 DUF4249 family protein [Dawidia soli]
MKRCYVFLLFALPALGLLHGCTPETDLDELDYTPKLVVDGAIENRQPPRVVLSHSASYFDNIDSASIRKLMETTAKVTVSDGEHQEVLTLQPNRGFFPPYVYEANTMRGEVGKTYTLTIDLKGKRYTATTTIPTPPSLDSLWFELTPGKDSLGYLYGRLSDPPDVANYYRVFTQRQTTDDRYIPMYQSAVGDQYFNGKQFTFTILRGPDDFTNIVDDLYFSRGDTVFIKACSIDRSHFDFWRTLERELYVVGNPFASSGNDILSNIKGDNVLGVWGGYGSTYYRTIIR